ncbi:keratin, type I cytoskeletal 47 kDa-like isoform X2 [Sphaeramia orbicularis]|uniref:keratin, type I cytoskeletal 47 kDa-like isoform X2 n=1 Tax=Sphaeramia orbicularis TaxID=375764 RepID=UPI0011810CB8|nr:keratin, type I cytoskeletal 47 kDa-like isoform X2 [Sphaeramia orbicularis]
MSIIRSKTQTAVQVYGSMGDAQTADGHLKNKSEKEPAAPQSPEATAAKLKQILDRLTRTRSDAKTQIRDLEEELEILKKNNQEVSGCHPPKPGPTGQTEQSHQMEMRNHPERAGLMTTEGHHCHR